MVVVKLGRIVVHDLLRRLQGILVLKGGRLLIFDVDAGLLVRMILDLLKQVLNRAVANGPLVHDETGRKLPVLAHANLVEQVQRKVLAVVVDEVVRRPLLSHVEDGHLACEGKSLQ